MSDPVKKAESEDVLSSVRRLVREQDGEQDMPTQNVRRKPGRLLLTPALRIADMPEGRRGAARTPLVLGRAQQVADSARHDRNEPANETVAGVSAHQTFEAHAQVEPSFAMAAETKAVKKQVVDRGVIRVEPAISLSAKIEALEAAIAQTEDQWEPDGDSTDAYAGTRIGAMEWHEEDRPSQHTDDGASVAEKATEKAEPAPYVLESEQVTEESRPANRGTDREPGGNFDDDDMLDFEFAGAVEAVIDEEALRQLVSDIVREELQGALGERITRNVRKLVRREIHRALDAQDLD